MENLIITPATSTNVNRNLLIGVTGSVAAIKLPLIVRNLLARLPLKIAIVGTKNSYHFFNPSDLDGTLIYTDENEWETWKSISDPVLHIQLRKWADVLLIAPLDANTLAKISTGICDNLLTCVARAWDPKKPFIFCPAMNTFMYTHPLTKESILKLQSWGYEQIPVVSKKLACGDIGEGGMAEVDTIVNRVHEIIGSL